LALVFRSPAQFPAGAFARYFSAALSTAASLTPAFSSRTLTTGMACRFGGQSK
jgi:hypothetical protein